MEYCDGGSLRHFAASALLEEPHISYISSQILHGLVYLHTQHRIHRDIKADSIYFYCRINIIIDLIRCFA